MAGEGLSQVPLPLPAVLDSPQGPRLFSVLLSGPTVPLLLLREQPDALLGSVCVLVRVGSRALAGGDVLAGVHDAGCGCWRGVG